MSVRMLALELYHAMKEVKKLEAEIAKLAPGASERDELEHRLREARAEESRLKKMLQGAKE